ncbi:FapA family protein [Idiomarina seosinensis]|uniref:DUF342 domain-containing protein n=1 Tax=Idiomarina seosinensis TaxID=281739 RepID=UPI00384CB6CC
MPGNTSQHVRFNSNGSDVYIAVSAAAKNVKGEHLKQAFQLSEFASAQLADSGVFNAVATKFNQWAEQQGQSNGNYTEAVAQLIDATLAISISEDNMLATAEVTSPYGGQPITRPKFLSELKRLGVSSGIQRGAINQAIQHCIESPSGSTIELTVAKGRWPKNGQNAYCEALVEDSRHRVLKPQQRDDGRVDMRDLGKHITVHEGEPLMRRYGPEPGADGFTVKGEHLPAEAGEDLQLAEGEGSKISDDDSNLLVATKVGMPWFTHNTANIDDVLTLKSVDVSTGHVDFKGSVIISGNVSEGMRIVAAGDITVAGYVDSAELRAGGNITVRKGCIGHISKEEEQRALDNESFIPHLTAKLNAAGSIWCAYAQYAYLESVQGILVDKQLTHCHVITSGTAEIGGNDKQARGKIIGGTFETCAPIFAGQLGARAGTRTRFLLSEPPPNEDILNEMQGLGSGFKSTISKLKRLQLGLQRCQALTDEEQREQHTRTLVKAITQERSRLSTYRDDLAVVKAASDDHPPLKISVGREVFPGVKLYHRDKTVAIKEHRSATLFMLQQHQIRMDVLS